MKGSIKVMNHPLKQFKNAQKLYFFKYKTNINKTWRVVKETLITGQLTREVFAKTIVVNN